MNKVAFIIPGFGCPTKNKEYQQIAGFFRKRNIKPVLVEIDWKRNTHVQYVAQFREQFSKYSNSDDKTYVLGFSYGAMTACDASSILNPTVQILCSLSPYFSEDMPFIKEWWKRFAGKRRCAEFEKLSFTKIAKKIACRTFIIAGDKEGIEVERRAKDAKNKIKNSELIFLDGVKHNIADVRYLKKIEQIINSL